eukprot:6796432-Pyramimonas_sp.AAC.1
MTGRYALPELGLATWNARALCHRDPIVRLTKQRYPRDVPRGFRILAVQKSHGSEFDVSGFLHMSSSGFQAESSFFSELNMGGVIAFAPKEYRRLGVGASAASSVL